MTEAHPFSQFIRVIARGPNLSRPLTEEEMLEAARLILKDEVDPLQLGAFLCVLRVRTEIPEEGAGFVRACREEFDIPTDMPEVDLDLSSYSGKKRQLPWFLLSALCLAQNGIRVAMQGTEGHTEGRLYSREVLETLGVPVAGSLAEAADHIRASNFCYLPLAKLVKRLQDLIELKPILGVRTPINTFARMLNPFNAPHEMQTVFHPNYRDIHRDTAKLLGQKHMAVFKGEGGEAERRPTKPVLVQSLHDGVLSEEEWPSLLPDDLSKTDEDMDLSRLKAVWAGEDEHKYGEAAVVGTMGIALNLMGRASSPADAIALAEKMWAERNRETLLAAA